MTAPVPETIVVDTPYGEFNFWQVEDTLSAQGQSTALRVIDEVVVQISGTATSITAQVERSTRDPASSPNWAPCGAQITGNVSLGIPIRRYMEPTRGWWRLNVLSMSGGTSITVVVSGQKA